jgi:hypothetical protein
VCRIIDHDDREPHASQNDQPPSASFIERLSGETRAVTAHRTKSSDTGTVDIFSILSNRRQIAHIWETGDVRACRPDLSDDEAWTVLQHVEKHLDSAFGITWETITDFAAELFPLGQSGADESAQPLEP